MNEDLAAAVHGPGPHAGVGVVRRVRLARQLARHDRLSAQLAREHATLAVLTQARHTLELVWSRRQGCSACPRHGSSGHGGATGVGVCVVGALLVASPGPQHDDAARRALDLTWHKLFEAGHRPVHWYPAPTMHAVQARELRQWNDAGDRTALHVITLLRETQTAADRTLRRVRAAVHQLAAAHA